MIGIIRYHSLFFVGKIHERDKVRQVLGLRVIFFSSTKMGICGWFSACEVISAVIKRILAFMTK